MSFVAISLAMAACATTAAESESSSVLNQLTAADIRRENVRGDNIVTAYDAVDWLARWWFHDFSGDASGELTVYLDTNQRLGNKESLRDICAADVFLLRYVKSADAVARFGPEAAGGAIVVTLRAGDAEHGSWTRGARHLARLNTTRPPGGRFPCLQFSP